MNNNHGKFQWYLNSHFCAIFEALFLDVNEKHMKKKIGFIGTITIYLISAIGCVDSYFSARQLSVTSIYTLSIFVGIIQVSERLFV